MNTLSNTIKVAVVGGEGIGPEVTDQSHRILKWFSDRRGAPVVLDKAVIDGLAAEIEASQGAGRVSVDLQEQTVTSPSGVRHVFEIDPRRRAGLLEGLDEISLTLRRDHEIRAFQASDRDARPWIHFAGQSAGHQA